MEIATFALFLLPLFYWTKLEIVVIALNASTVVATIAFFTYSKRVVDVRLTRIFLAPIFISIITFGFYFFLEDIIRSLGNIYTYIIASTVVIVATYLSSTLVFEYKYTRDIFTQLKSK